MASSDEFEQIIGSVPELAELDDGITVSVTRGEEEVCLTGVEFNGFVQLMLKQIIECPAQWFLALDEFRDRGELVMRAVVRSAYNDVASFVFEEADVDRIPDLVGVMAGMALMSRESSS